MKRITIPKTNQRQNGDCPIFPAESKGFREELKFLRKREQQKLGLISHPSPGLSSSSSTWLSAHSLACRVLKPYKFPYTRETTHIAGSSRQSLAHLPYRQGVTQSCSCRAWHAGVTGEASLTGTQQMVGEGAKPPLSRTGHNC